MGHILRPYPKGYRIFLRHAHRDTSDKNLDNGLSPRGIRQGKRLEEWIKKNHPFVLEHVFSSPKKRCLETAQFVCKVLNLKLEVLTELDEQNPFETEKEFKKRIQRLIESSSFLNQSLFCSHGDVLPEIGQILGKPHLSIEKGNLFIEINGAITSVNPIKHE